MRDALAVLVMIAGTASVTAMIVLIAMYVRAGPEYPPDPPGERGQ
jgi:hypothetical protein